MRNTDDISCGQMVKSKETKVNNLTTTKVHSSEEEEAVATAAASVISNSGKSSVHGETTKPLRPLLPIQTSVKLADSNATINQSEDELNKQNDKKSHETNSSSKAFSVNPTLLEAQLSILKNLEKTSRREIQMMGKTTPSYSNHLPMKLYRLLMNNNHTCIIDWTPAGTACIIYDVDEFQRVVMPEYFPEYTRNDDNGRSIELFKDQAKLYPFLCKNDNTIQTTRRSRYLPPDVTRRRTLMLKHKWFRKGEESLCKLLCQERCRVNRFSTSITNRNRNNNNRTNHFQRLVKSKLQNMRNSIIVPQNTAAVASDETSESEDEE